VNCATELILLLIYLAGIVKFQKVSLSIARYENCISIRMRPLVDFTWGLGS
jgi:hypothetical protein